MPLTDQACRNSQCSADKPRERFADAGGLYLEVAASGSKRWFWKYRYAGKEKRLAIGMYPDVGLAQARRNRDEARLKLRDGFDPVQAKRDVLLARKLAIGTTFEAVSRDWFAHWGGDKSERHSSYALRRLEADVFPVLGAKPIGDITAPRLLAMAKKIEVRGAIDIAKRSLQTCGQIMRYAVAHGIIERNPAADVRPGDALEPRRKTHYSRVDAKELPALLRDIRMYRGSAFTRSALELMVLTFVRTSELIEARREEFDLEKAEWRIPESRM